MVPVAPNKVKGDKLIILQLILPYYLRTYLVRTFVRRYKLSA